MVHNAGGDDYWGGARTWHLPNQRERWGQGSTDIAQALNPNARKLWRKPKESFGSSRHPARANQIPDARVPRMKSRASNPRFRHDQGSHELRCLLWTAFASTPISISSSMMTG